MDTRWSAMPHGLSDLAISEDGYRLQRLVYTATPALPKEFPHGPAPRPPSWSIESRLAESAREAACDPAAAPSAARDLLPSARG
eukprot:8178390-Pyramimonas_sp.AAC.1